jgi:ribonuclease HI
MELDVWALAWKSRSRVIYPSFCRKLGDLFESGDLANLKKNCVYFLKRYIIQMKVGGLVEKSIEFYIHPITPSAPMSRPESDFLRYLEATDQFLAVYTDGSAINTDTETARARSGIFMARETDIKAFEMETFSTMLDEKISILIQHSKEDIKTRGKAAEQIVDELIESLDQQYPTIRFSGEIVDGPYQSWYGEYMAIYQALLNVEKFPNLKLKIFTDHQSLANLFSDITKCSDEEFNSQQNLSGIPILSAIRHLERQRRFPTIVTWIKAHSGIFGNVIADHLAGNTLPRTTRRKRLEFRARWHSKHSREHSRERGRRLARRSRTWPSMPSDWSRRTHDAGNDRNYCAELCGRCGSYASLL